jgi:hypothetical protein
MSRWYYAVALYYLHILFFMFISIYNDLTIFIIFIRLSFFTKKVLAHTHTHTHTYLTLSYLALSVVPFTRHRCSCCSPTCWEHRG